MTTLSHGRSSISTSILERRGMRFAMQYPSSLSIRTSSSGKACFQTNEYHLMRVGRLSLVPSHRIHSNRTAVPATTRCAMAAPARTRAKRRHAVCTRDIYIPDLHIDSIKVKTRDFR